MRKILVVSFTVALLPALAGAETVATVGKKSVTRDAVEKEVQDQLDDLEQQRYDILRAGIEQLVATELIEQEAAARGVSADALQNTEIVEKSTKPSDEEVKKLYDDNQAQMGGQTLDQMKERLAQYLMQERMQKRALEFIAELKKKYPTKILLRPKTIDVGLGSRPPFGDAKAPITIVEFSDYECPFCKRAEPTVKEVLKFYGDKVRLAYRDFPLPNHTNARPASEAAYCANEQGKFWQYHDKVMAASDLSAANLKALAQTAGLDEKKFDECVSADRFEAKINEDITAGEAAGVSGTPAFFINGRMMDGAQPLEKFKEVIDEELEFAGSKS